MINYNNYQYDDNGNMKEIKTLSVPLSKPSAPPTLIAQRNLFWNEEDQLQAMIDFNNSAYYFYNYTGERTWKVVGPKITQTMSGTTIKYNKFNQSTYYLFPQVSVTNTNYTKHIFAGEERICSKIGNGRSNFNPEPITPTQAEISAKRSNQINLMKKVFPNLCIPYYPHLLCVLENNANILNSNLLKSSMKKITTLSTVYEDNQYFYVSDHLGSSAWITNKAGNAIQHMQYLPFGEIFVNQKVSGSTYDSEFKFLGKELDSETGYTKTDNRYYWANAGIFLSVDPLCDERPWITPFNYAQNNPIGRKDPTGLLDDWYKSESGQLLWSSASTKSISFNGETFSNIATGNCLPDEYQSNAGVNLIISGHQTNGTENADWDRHASQIYNGNSDKSNVLAIASNSDDFVQAFVVATENFGQVNNAAVRSHAGDYGLGLGSGNYFENFLTSEMSSFAGRINNTISFADNAQVFFMGCNTDFLSRVFTTQTGVTSIGSVGLTGPQNPRGSFLSTYRFNKYSWNNGLVEKNLGNVINIRF